MTKKEFTKAAEERLEIYRGILFHNQEFIEEESLMILTLQSCKS